MSHNVVLRILIGIFFNINKNEWFKIDIDYLSLYEFLLINNQIIPNIDRRKFTKLFKNFYA